MTCVEVNPIIRPVFIVVEEVPRPHHRTAAITRRPDYTVIHIHPGSDVTTVGCDVNQLIEDDSEYRGWATPYLGEDEIALARFRASPTTGIPDHILKTPILARYIPHQLRAPWANYL